MIETAGKQKLAHDFLTWFLKLTAAAWRTDSSASAAITCAECVD